MLNKGATLIEDYPCIGHDDCSAEDFMVVDGVKARLSSWIRDSLKNIRSFCTTVILFIQARAFSLASFFSEFLSRNKQHTNSVDEDFLVVDGVTARISSWMKTFLKKIKLFCMTALLFVKKRTFLLASFFSKGPSTNGQQIVFLFSFVSVVWFALMRHTTQQQQQVPFDASRDLSNFINFERANLMERAVITNDIENVSADLFKMYARATCVQGADNEHVRLALYAGLDGIPDSVRSKLVKMAVAKGISQKYSIHDTITDFQEEGRLFSYKAFWSTVYLPTVGYDTCLLATGVDLKMAGTIVGWNEIPQKVQVATEPCHCGFIYCATCPVFHEFTAKEPIYERRSMSLKNQKELRNWMIEKSIEVAEPLVIASEAGSNSFHSFFWSGPSEDYHNVSTDHVQNMAL